MIYENCDFWINYDRDGYYVDFFADVASGKDLENVSYLQNVSPKPDYAVIAIKDQFGGAIPFAAIADSDWIYEQEVGCTVADSLSHAAVKVDEYLDMVADGEDVRDYVVFDDNMLPDTIECDAEYISVWEDTEVHSEVKVRFNMETWPLAGEITEWGERWFDGEPASEEELENITEEYVQVGDERAHEYIVFTAMKKDEFDNFGKDDPTYYSNENGIITY